MAVSGDPIRLRAGPGSLPTPHLPQENAHEAAGGVGGEGGLGVWGGWCPHFEPASSVDFRCQQGSGEQSGSLGGHHTTQVSCEFTIHVSIPFGG